LQGVLKAYRRENDNENKNKLKPVCYFAKPVAFAFDDELPFDQENSKLENEFEADVGKHIQWVVFRVGGLFEEHYYVFQRNEEVYYRHYEEAEEERKLELAAHVFHLQLSWSLEFVDPTLVLMNLQYALWICPAFLELPFNV
jgi:hypothetical protein